MANALCFKLHVDTDTVTLHDLGAYVGKTVTVFVVANDDTPATPTPTRKTLPLPFGIDRGKIAVGPDFDTLPEDLQAAFEGKDP